jgi:peptidoglycan/xylan/chitin deacetylase (PgdA/CDA1 family)
MEQALMRILGVKPAFMRPPYGDYNDQVRAAAAMYGHTVALWDFFPGDATGTPPAQCKEEYSKLAALHPSTVLALNHETYGE